MLIIAYQFVLILLGGKINDEIVTSTTID